jgi:ATP-dependent 26S proteasome regulatory subunit/intein/homing endonuclease
VLRRILPKIDLEQEFIPSEILDSLRVTREDFFNALREVRPSALREVFVERPNVHWGDIGGLENVKKELKEAVELPLKSPEVFAKMGIRPVKGILLVGLPGTGKTMFAKAVATETEANFISIKGPEVLSKWVGESLSYDETIWVADEGNLKRMKIGELVDAHMNENENRGLVQKTAQKQKLMTFTLDENGRSVLAPIGDFVRHHAPESLYHITTRMGRGITVTADHALFTLTGGAVGATAANRLIAGETYVAMPSRLPTIGKEAVWDIAESFKDNPHAFVKPSPLFKKAVETLGVGSAASLLGLSVRYVRENIARGKNSLSLPTFRKLMDAANVAFDSSELCLGYFGSSQVLPGRLHASRDLCYALGFWVAEGDYNKTCLRFSNHNEENRRELVASLARLGIGAKAYKGAIRVEHPLLAHFFKKTLALAPYADNKRVPDFLFAAPRHHMAAFLRGYYSGDGSVHGNDRRSYVEASTSSRRLAHDLQHMLLHFGIVAALREGIERRNGREKFKVLFSGVSNFEKFVEIGFSQGSKQGRLLAYPSKKAWGRSSQVPLDAGMRVWLMENGFAEWAGSATIGIDKLRQALERRDPQRAFKLAWELVESDYHWDKVVSVIKVPYGRQYVYDIGVPGCQRFLAGEGDLLVHNSEKAVRETFRKARMATPCVIFIDEIDSIAPTRGASEEGNRVTERIVDTLLTEMDGLTGLKNVVVIAATNRPELMDMALMRGGRFDRIIEIPPPDEKTRLEILKIHTKAMPLAKQVDLPEIAKKTDGYTGADIENVCREAGMAAIRRGVGTDKVEAKDFDSALESVKPSITKAYVDKIKKFAKGEANTMYR